MLNILSAVVTAAMAASVPQGLAAPPNASLVLRAQARGVQIYVCAAQPDQPGRYDWRFVAPQADLFGPDGARIGRHYAGPSWEGADGGKVVGEVRAKAPSPDPSAIDWLLLSAKSANGAGVLGTVRFVQRVDTVGGRAPAGGCSGANAGEETRVPYSAEYDFYTSR
jgi:hypothetical protein